MKKILLSSLMAAAAAVPAFAGVDNINYQAVIKNGNEIVANSQVDMMFELLDNETVVYSEQQSMITNASGLVSCQLGGEGLSTIEWGDLTLRVSINFGNGYEVISNETVSSVPTALYALRSADSDNIREEVDAFATMVEGRFDKVMGNVDANTSNIETLTEQTDAFATMLETRLDKMQTQVDRLDEALEVSGTTDYSSLVKDLEALKVQTEEGLAKVEVFADAVDAVEGIVAANEETEAKLRNMSADLAQVEGLAEKVEQLEENLAIIVSPTDPDSFVNGINTALGTMQTQIDEVNTNTESFASMVETRIDKLQGNVDANTQAIEELNVGTENMATMIEGRLDKMQGNVDANDKAIEALTDQVDAFASMNEERLDKMQGNIDANDKAIEGLTEQIDAFASMNEERLDKMQKQVDTLDADVVPEIEGLVKENEEIKSTLNSFGADIAQISGLAEKVEQLESSVQMIADPTDPDSLINGMSERMAAMEEEFNAKITELMKTIAELEDEIKALKGE